MSWKIAGAILEIFGLFAIGAILRWRGLLRHGALDRLSNIVFDILFPLMIFASLYRGLRADQLYHLWSLPVIGFGLMAFGAAIGLLLQYGMRQRENGRVETFLHFCAVNNFQFLPLIVIANLWGPGYLPLLFILNLGSNLGQWTIGIVLLSGGSSRQALKNIFNPNVYAIVASILIIVLHVPVPALLVDIAALAGSAALPMCLMVVGAALFGASRHLLRNWWDVVWLCLCRLVILPLLTIVLLKLLPLPEEVYRISFVVGIMPVSMSATVLTIRYGGSPEYAGQAAVITTIASLLTMPLLMLLL
ncbi:MAG: AEC family transporter [Victivallales bacterium]|nr:AEC family transporter [Victivallales bacterium]